MGPKPRGMSGRSQEALRLSSGQYHSSHSQKGAIPMSTQPTIKSVCDLLAKSIKDKVSEIQILTERLEKLLCQPNPDPAHIQQIKTDIQRLNDQLEVDQGQLNILKEDFAASCLP